MSRRSLPTFPTPFPRWFRPAPRRITSRGAALSIPALTAAAVATAVTVAALLVAPPPASADWQAGMEAFQQKDWSRAEAELRAVVAEKPDWYGGYRMLGQTLLEAGRAGEAIPFLEKALALKPGDASGRFTLGRAAAAAESHRLARSTLAGERPDGLSDAQWQAWLRIRSDAARNLDRNGEARLDLEKVIALGATDAETSYLLGYLALQDGDAEAALAPLGQARRAASGSDPEMEARALGLELGILHSRATSRPADEQEAACRALVEEARRLVELEPPAKSLARAGRVLGCAGEASESTGLLRRAVAAGADDWRTRYQLARQLAFSGQPAESIARLEKLLAEDLAPDEASTTHDFLGYVLETEKRYTEAIEHYRAAGSEPKVASARESHRLHLDNLENAQRRADLERLEKELDRLNQEAEEVGGGSRPRPR